MSDKRPRLPGDPPRPAHRMIRVDHAGEYGATRIYAGQLAVMRGGTKTELVRHMRAQEQVHLDTFNDLTATAALGERAAMACTVAVEETIDAHYTAQIEALGDTEPSLRQTLETIRTEEREHRGIGLANGAAQTPGYRLLSSVIKAGCKVAIKLSERF